MPTAPWRRRYVIKHACGSKTTTRARVPKEIREVGVDDVRVTPEQQLLHVYDCLLGVSLGTVGVDFRLIPDELPRLWSVTSFPSRNSGALATAREGGLPNSPGITCSEAWPREGVPETAATNWSDTLMRSAANSE